MVRVEKLYDTLQAHGVDFFTGVPDSLLKDFCAYVTDHTPCGRHYCCQRRCSRRYSRRALYGLGSVAVGIYAELGSGKYGESFAVVDGRKGIRFARPFDDRLAGRTGG